MNLFERSDQTTKVSLEEKFHEPKIKDSEILTQILVLLALICPLLVLH